jgi:septum formation protein
MAGFRFEVAVADVEESPRSGESALAYCARVALDKASTVARLGMVSLGADTEVVLGRRIFGKPASAGDALAMLGELSGRRHRVISAVAIVAGEQVRQLQVISRVRFRLLGRSELEDYVATGEAFGKAGGYAVQGRAATFVAAIDGSYTAVVGLPVYETTQALAEFGIWPDWRLPIDSPQSASL